MLIIVMMSSYESSVPKPTFDDRMIVFLSVLSDSIERDILHDLHFASVKSRKKLNEVSQNFAVQLTSKIAVHDTTN